MSRKKIKKLPEINKINFPYDLVIVYWEDIISNSEWTYISEIKNQRLLSVKV